MGLSSKVRFKIDYLKLIRNHGFSEQFEEYKYSHDYISEKRAARAFCLKNDLVKFFYFDIKEFLNLPNFPVEDVEGL